MRITMTSPLLRRRRQADRRWQPQSRLADLLGVDLAAECVAAVLPETNGIGTATPRRGAAVNLTRSSATRWLSNQSGTVRQLPPDGWRTEAGIFQAATNQCLHSEGLTQAVWTPLLGVTAALDGATSGPLPNVFKLTDAGSSPSGALYQTLSGLADAQPYAMSVYVKAGTTTGFTLGLFDTTYGWRAQSFFTVSGSTISVSLVYRGSCVLEPIPQSSWYRITVGAPTVVAANVNRAYLFASVSGVAQAGYLWMTGVQVQQGELAQPYIATTTAAASRSADQADLPTGGIPLASTLGLVTRILDHAATPYLLHLPGTSGDNNRLDLSVSPTTGLNFTVYDGSGAAKTWLQNAAPVNRELACWIVSNDNAGAVRAWKNGAELTLTPGGTGTGVRDASTGAFQIGRCVADHFLQGEIRSLLQFGSVLDAAQIGRLHAALRRLES